MWFASRRTLVVRGLVTVAFGLLVILRPAVSLDVLVLLFGAFALVEGALSITAAVLAARGERGRAPAFVVGVWGVIVGAITLLWPGVTQLALLVLIAIRALVIGAAEFAMAVHVGRWHGFGNSPTSWLLAVAGLISLGFGTMLLVYPQAGLLALVWIMGVYAVLMGLIAVARAWLLTIASYGLTAPGR
jgi:uncharacterized membrane protein HdeD (DUF308 family)